MVVAVLPLYGKIVTGQPKEKGCKYIKGTDLRDLSALKAEFYIYM